MAYKGVLDDIRTCIKLGIPERLPVFALSEEFDVRMAGMTYEEYSSDVGNVVRSQSEGIKRFDYDWTCIYIDDCLEFEPLGIVSVGSGNIPRAVKDFLPAEYSTLKKLKIPRPDKDGRLPILLEAISRIKKEWGDKILICGRAPAPFSSITLLYGINATMLLLYDNPQLLRDTIDYFIEQQYIIGKAQLEVGADALWIGDCSASSRFISLEWYKEFAFQPAKKLIKEFKNTGGLTLYFAGETNIEYLKVMADLGTDVLGMSEEGDIFEAKRKVGDKVCLMGNIDPINILLYGTPDEVAKHTKKIKEEVSLKGGHIFNTGEGIPRETPEENVRAMIRTIKES